MRAVETLLNYTSCDPAQKNEDGGWTAYHWAAKKNALKSMEILLRNCPEATEGPKGIDQRNDGNKTALHIAARFNYKEMVELLLKNNADVDIRAFEDRMTADDQPGVSEEIKEMIRNARDKKVLP